MIERYSRPQMTSIFSDQTRFEIWLQVETLALEGMVQEGLAPAEALKAVREKGQFKKDRVLEIEREVKHDVIAFLTNVAEYVGDLSHYTHRGMTSSDLLDTAFAIQLKRAGELLLSDLDRVCAVIKVRAEEHRHTPCIGRSHGIHAEPVTFGLKLAGWYAEFRRNRVRLVDAIREIAVGKISGPVGTYASIPPAVEAHVMKALGLAPETVATQVVARDRHAQFFQTLALIGAAVERCAVEVRHLQRTEVREAEERFTKGQKGSSAMPHKRNPILSENLCGLARLLRGYASSALENVPLWHERDISHSSVERVIGPDACIVADFMLNRCADMVEGLVVYPDQMQRNLDLTRGTVYSGSLLVKLVDRGMKREDAYRLVQQHALAAYDGGADFPTRVRADADIARRLSVADLDDTLTLKRHLAHIDTIVNRALAL